MWPRLMNGERGQVAFKRIVGCVEHPLGQSVFSRVEQRQELAMTGGVFPNNEGRRDGSQPRRRGKTQAKRIGFLLAGFARARRWRDLSAVEANRERFFRQRFEASARGVELRLGDSPVTISIHWR